MKVVRSKVIGFCFGVSNTIDKANECVALSRKSGLPCYSIGALIHNKDVVKHYEDLGMKCIKGPEDVAPGIALVRAHGVPDRVKREYLNAGFNVIDSTCPIVAKGAVTIRKAAQRGIRTMIIGVKDHAETLGLQGVEVSEGTVVESIMIYRLEDAKALVESGTVSPDEEIVVVCQTTYPEHYFNLIRDCLSSYFKKIKFSNSPCGATLARKKAALELASQTDAVIVIGGKSSENTKGLAIVVKDTGKPVYCIENTDDLTEDFLKELSVYSSIGICSGSSTPTTIIRAVEEILERL